MGKIIGSLQHTDDDDDGKFSIKIDDEKDNEYSSPSRLMSKGIW